MSDWVSWRPLLPPALVLVLLLATAGLLLAAAWRGTRTERSRWLLRAGMAVLVALVLLRPGVGQAPVAATVTDLDVVVVVDRTVSMSARDWNGDQPRLEGVRQDLSAVTAALPGSRFALITWGRYARTELPPTTDLAAFGAAVAAVQREGVFDGEGSSPDRPLEELTALLERAEDQHPDRRRIVVFASDGEVTADGEPASYADLAPLVDDGLVLGYGTTAGGRMPMYDGAEAEQFGDGGWVYDQDTGADALSRVDEGNLRAIAAELGVGYSCASDRVGCRPGPQGWSSDWSRTCPDRPRRRSS